MNIENKVSDICENYFSYLLSLENVNGVGLGYKYINDFDTNEPCIHVLVDKKLNPSHISTNNLIPKDYMGIKTDVISTGEIQFLSSSKLPNIIRPLEGGYGLSSIPTGVKKGSVNSGTLGCIVTKFIDNKKRYFILSNNHILTNFNKTPIGSKIIQPSAGDDGNLHDVVAYLSSFIPLKKENFFYTPSNYVDCAIAEIDKSLVTDKIALVGKIRGISTTALNLKVKKVGKVTGLTTGKVITMGVTTSIKTNKNKYVVFKKQIRALMEASKGDSGAVVLNDFNQIVGLLFAGTSSNNTSVFNNIDLVLKALEVDLYTEY